MYDMISIAIYTIHVDITYTYFFCTTYIYI